MDDERQVEYEIQIIVIMLKRILRTVCCCSKSLRELQTSGLNELNLYSKIGKNMTLEEVYEEIKLNFKS